MKKLITLQVIFTAYLIFLIYSLVSHYFIPANPNLCPPGALCDGPILPIVFNLFNLVLNLIFLIGYLIFEYKSLKKEDSRAVSVTLFTMIALRMVSYFGLMYINSLPDTF